MMVTLEHAILKESCSKARKGKFGKSGNTGFVIQNMNLHINSLALRSIHAFLPDEKRKIKVDLRCSKMQLSW